MYALSKLAVLLILLSSVEQDLGIDIKGFDDSIIFKLNWPGQIIDHHISSDLDSVHVITQHNEQFRCILPNISLKEKDAKDNYSGPSPLSILSPLFRQNSCSYRLESYWTYELCHGLHVRQYHEDREGKKVKVQEYFLGLWNKREFDKLEEEILEAGSSYFENLPTKKIDGIEVPYIQINMTDGTLCDLSQKPRSTLVYYVCHAEARSDIYSLKETSTCEYEIIVLSSLLCEHPKFRPKESGEHPIDCFAVKGAAKKPRNLVALEAESLKLRHQKISDEKMQRVYAIFSLDGEGQDGEARVRVEIHPVPVPSPSTENAQEISHTQDLSPVHNFLSGKNCLNGGTGWWKFKFCYGKTVEQFHIEKDGSKTVLLLGKFDVAKHLEWIQQNPHKRPKTTGGQRKQISHFYSDGTVCDITLKPRHTEVKLKCLESGSGAIALYLSEQNTCEYVLGVESPLLCDFIEKADSNGLIPAPVNEDTSQIMKEDK